MSERDPATPHARVVKSRRVRHGLVIVNTGEGIGPGLRRRAWTCEPSRGRGGRRGVLHGRRTATDAEDFQPCRRYRDQLADRSRPTAMPMSLQRQQKERLTSKERPPELFSVTVPKLLANDSTAYRSPKQPPHHYLYRVVQLEMRHIERLRNLPGERSLPRARRPHHNDAVGIPKAAFSIGALGVGHDETFAVQHA